jgi:hypothetical protein
MSHQFSDTTNKDGIIQHCERELGFDYGDISGDTERLAAFTADTNTGLDEVATIHALIGGQWQHSDTNHTKYPLLEADIVSGQQDYTFDEDADGNKILDIYKVMAKFDASDDLQTLEQKDLAVLGKENDGFMSPGSGASQAYDLIANGIFLENTPTANVTDGLLIFPSVEGSYFTTTDTTKTPGYDGRFHYYLVLHNCEKYARIHQLDSHKDLQEAKLRMRIDMENVLRGKNKAVRRGMKANVESTR